ncbi:MAG: Hsp70 family protein [Chloroflexi bacterium]|nr:Hsp70 family protein [Chloroflexota bacterium]
MKKDIPCPKCGGSGICGSCSGTGYVMKGFPFKRRVLCDSCGGMSLCNVCKGSRRVSASSHSLGKIDLSRGSLGLEINGGRFYPIVKMGSHPPLEQKQIFSTAVDNEESIELHFGFGNDTKKEHNTSLGRVQLRGIPPAPKGVPQIEVTIQIDQRGDVSLYAMDNGNGKEIIVTGNFQTMIR